MKELTIPDFFNTQYREYCKYDSERSLPNLIDGFKISQRKVLHTCVEKNIISEYKVAQLGSLVSNFTNYHHGEAGLSNVITNLAQTFVGSNSINYLEPLGQFGSRLSSVPASPRYIFTKLSKNFRTYFKKDDDIILAYLYDDNARIEPRFFIPILPGILLNSTMGIGTGFAANVLSRNVIELKDYILAKLNNQSTDKFSLIPYFGNFKGEVNLIEGTKYQILGRFHRVSATQIKISELPIGMFLEDAKKCLNSLISTGFIKDYDDNSSEESFDIDVYFQRGILNTLDDDTLLDKLKLSTTMTENLTCWLESGKLKKFTDVKDIIDYFIEFRLTAYTKRINRMIEILEEDIISLSEKIRFINFYLNNVDEFRNTSKTDLIELLENEKFFTSMLELKIYNLTKDKIKEHEDNLKKLIKQKKELQKTKNIDLYKKELHELC